MDLSPTLISSPTLLVVYGHVTNWPSLNLLLRLSQVELINMGFEDTKEGVEKAQAQGCGWPRSSHMETNCLRVQDGVEEKQELGETDDRTLFLDSVCILEQPCWVM